MQGVTWLLIKLIERQLRLRLNWIKFKWVFLMSCQMGWWEIFRISWMIDRYHWLMQIESDKKRNTRYRIKLSNWPYQRNKVPNLSIKALSKVFSARRNNHQHLLSPKIILLTLLLERTLQRTSLKRSKVTLCHHQNPEASLWFKWLRKKKRAQSSTTVKMINQTSLNIRIFQS